MVENIRYLNADEVRHIHEYIRSVSGSVPGEMYDGLESMCQTAKTYNQDQTLEEVAAFYLSRIAKGHSFVDGNKRAAYFSTRYFLMLNGADFNGRDVAEAVKEMESIAAADNGKSYAIARELTKKYVIRDQIKLESIEQFERIVLKSIGVAVRLSKE